MDKPFSWKSHSRMIGFQETLAWIVGAMAILIAIVLFTFSETLMRMMSIAVLALGFVAVVHHISTSLRMKAIEELKIRLDRFEAALTTLVSGKDNSKPQP